MYELILENLNDNKIFQQGKDLLKDSLSNNEAPYFSQVEILRSTFKILFKKKPIEK